jgi:CRISPR-associated endonuclease Csy4
VRRLQAKSSPARPRARLIRRKNISEEDAFLLIPDTPAKKISLPFIVLYSQSTGQKFRLFISQTPCQILVDGKFNSYGLSDVATVQKF